jgi:hypothetical protein
MDYNLGLVYKNKLNFAKGKTNEKLLVLILGVMTISGANATKKIHDNDLYLCHTRYGDCVKDLFAYELDHHITDGQPWGGLNLKSYDDHIDIRAGRHRDSSNEDWLFIK